MSSLLVPGSHRAVGVVDDDALLAALLRVEVAWSQALVVAGLATSDQAAAVATAADALTLDREQLITDAELAGNPVIPLVAALRERASAPEAVHRGLTSQDVLDTALVLMLGAAADRLVADLEVVAGALATLAQTHRGTVMAGRTLTQWAVPTTFGLVAAQWLVGIAEARRSLATARDRLSVQYGGAVGTRALLRHLAPSADHDAVIAAFSAGLGLSVSVLPWHTRRGVLTGMADAFTTVTDALGVLAGDVLVLGRPEVGEVREGVAEGRGGSSTMPHKQNPVLAVLVRSAARRAPLLAAQLHLSSADAVDQRPPGAWHAEWPALQALAELAVVAGAQAAELVPGLRVDADAMTRRARHAAGELLAERGSGDTDVRSYLGQSELLIDEALAAHAAEDAPDA